MMQLHLAQTQLLFVCLQVGVNLRGYNLAEVNNTLTLFYDALGGIDLQHLLGAEFLVCNRVRHNVWNQSAVYGVGQVGGHEAAVVLLPIECVDVAESRERRLHIADVDEGGCGGIVAVVFQRMELRHGFLAHAVVEFLLQNAVGVSLP